MFFDISGSSLMLDNVWVSGENGQFDEEAWSALLTLRRGETTWKAPLKLKLESDLRVSDSRPVVAMFKNQDGWRPEFLSNMLTVEHIEGEAELEVADERVRIPHAHLTSDNIDVGAKATITEQNSDGVIFLRYKKMKFLLKISDGKKNLDIIGAQKKYDEYRVKR
jgi:hypothetical protein